MSAAWAFLSPIAIALDANWLSGACTREKRRLCCKVAVSLSVPFRLSNCNLCVGDRGRRGK